MSGIGVHAVVSNSLSPHAPLITSHKNTPLVGSTPNVPIMSTCATVMTTQSRIPTVPSPHVSFPTSLGIPWHAPTRVGPPPLIPMSQPVPSSAPKAWEFTAHVPSSQPVCARLEPTAPNVPSAGAQFTRAASLPGPVNHREPLGVSRQTLPISQPSTVPYPPLSCMPEMNDQVQGPNLTLTSVLNGGARHPREHAPTYVDARTSLPNPTNLGGQVTHPYATHAAARMHPTIGTHGPVASIPEAAYVPPVAAPTGFHGPVTGYYPTTHPTTQVKLPKLNMRKFNGNVTKWSTFWDSFASSMHENPSLSSIDKFNYLVSLLESTAAEAVAGLTPTDANYEEAISTLRKRFGNPQMIINRHMEALLSVPGVMSHQDIRGLRRLHDSIETHVRGLRALKVPAHSYGALLASALVNKLPPELKLILTRELGGSAWDLEQLMTAFGRELDARERVFVSGNTSGNKKCQPRPPTAAALVADSSGSRPFCVYCKKEHASSSCSTVTKVAARKESLHRDGRCFVCLKRHHLSRDCRCNVNCRKCRGRHHVSICTKGSGNSSGESTSHRSPPGTSGTTDLERPHPETSKGTQTINSHCSDPKTGILLQTARLHLISSGDEATEITARAMFDSGSQRTYISKQLRDRLQLPTVSSERIQIKTFGSLECSDGSYDVVQLQIRAKGEILTVSALVVPLVCSPLMSQPINDSSQNYEHLADLELADSADSHDLLEVDVLIGSDWYWSLITGRVIRGETGPIAIDSKVGWILSGPAGEQTTVNLTITPTHILKIDVYKAEPSLEDQLKQFWELESLGISSEEPPVHERFLQQISFDGQRYEVGLPWKEQHPPLRDHYELCCKRLGGLLRRLKQTPQILDEYNRIITDQLDRGIIERVPQTKGDRTHYLPHHGVIRQDKTTSKLRIVYDASARTAGPSLNDCLYRGPKFG